MTWVGVLALFLAFIRPLAAFLPGHRKPQWRFSCSRSCAAIRAPIFGNEWIPWPLSNLGMLPDGRKSLCAHCSLPSTNGLSAMENIFIGHTVLVCWGKKSTSLFSVNLVNCRRKSEAPLGNLFRVRSATLGYQTVLNWSSTISCKGAPCKQTCIAKYLQKLNRYLAVKLSERKLKQNQKIWRREGPLASANLRSLKTWLWTKKERGAKCVFTFVWVGVSSYCRGWYYLHKNSPNFECFLPLYQYKTVPCVFCARHSTFCR